MRILAFLSVLLISGAVCAQTYRSGGTRRANFGGQPQAQEDGQKASAPGANSGVKTRTFTSYGARQRAWSKGVQTQAVQTSTAGTSAPAQENLDEVMLPGAEKAVGAAAKKGAAAQPASSSGAKTGQEPSAQPQPQAPAAMPAEAAAAMQQLQGMQEMMKGLGAGMPGMPAAGAAGGKGGASAAPAGMPAILGMPDMSALMGGAAAQPAGKK